MEHFDIIEYISGLTSYVFDESVLKRIAIDRGVYDVEGYSGIDQRTKDLLKADLLYEVYLSPNVSASSSKSHGNFSETIGSQTIYADERDRLYNIFTSIYRKYGDDKLNEIGDNGILQWL